MHDYDALFWLLGYLRKYPDYGICFYPSPDKSPVNQLLDEHKISTNDIIAFSDASWQDCPDTGRSTCGHLILYQGGVVAANSHVPTPVAMSSAEAEYMSACAASMNASVIRMLLYDMRYLGTPDYKSVEDPAHFPPSILCVDNSAAITMSKSPKLTKKTRHIARHFHFVRNGVELNLHSLIWVSNAIQIADVLTKTQPYNKIAPMVKIFMFTLPKFLTEYISKTP
jgi:KUP system potassium uptake protein